MKLYFLLLFLVVIYMFLPENVNAQTHNSSSYVDMSDVQYIDGDSSNYKDFEDATLIVDYYKTEGISTGERYTYEIILIDSLVMVYFGAPQTDDYNYISYEKKFLIDSAQMDSVVSTLKAADLKQIKRGIPQPTGSAHTQEVLIVKHKGGKNNIAGGMFNMETFDNDMDEAAMNKEIELERKLTSSIGGDYDKFFAAMNHLFPDLENLLKESTND